ncbi:MAG: hypothetical protein A2178_00040 [Planctomycetes bacterium GWC2_49_10]|nr:MAG: hypothetical protein A2178_00040 [Planctomycetes bacterium GWC2_49_10]
MERTAVTICVVNYKTLDFTRLCLRSIRKFSSNYPYEVIVVDNNSADASLEYLRSLKWIRLIERKEKDQSGGHAHGNALDLGLANCNTEFFVSMHSDTFVHQDGWLNDLLSYFNDDENIACVGSGKLELTPRLLVWFKKITDYRTAWRKLLRKPDPTDIYRYYSRTICSLYRTEILKKHNLSFAKGKGSGFTVGKKLFFELVDNDYKTIDLPDWKMSKYVWHLAHASAVFDIADEYRRKNTENKCGKRLKKIMDSEVIWSIVNDESLDK